LDEPTNHLDIRSKEILKEALKKYDGTLIVISHDRDFLDGLTDKMYEFRDGNVKEFLGDVYAFLKSKKVDTIKEFERSDKTEKKKVKTDSKDKLNYEERKERDRTIRMLEGKVKKLEKSISEDENKIAELNKKLMNPENYSQDCIDEYEELKKSLENSMKQWEEAQEQLDDLKNKD